MSEALKEIYEDDEGNELTMTPDEEPLCPGCRSGIMRPKCLWELGSSCPRHAIRQRWESMKRLKQKRAITESNAWASTITIHLWFDAHENLPLGANPPISKADAALRFYRISKKLSAVLQEFSAATDISITIAMNSTELLPRKVNKDE